MKGSPSLLLAAMLSLPVMAHAAEPEQCKTVNFSDVRLDRHHRHDCDHQRNSQGRRPPARTTMISVPVTYKSLAGEQNMWTSS